MVRLNVVVEGRSEEAFVNRILAPHLGALGVVATAHAVTTRRDQRRGRLHRGGLSSFEQCRSDLRRWLTQQSGSDVRFTTMLDLYALPNDFPGSVSARALHDPYAVVSEIERRFAEAIGDWRFIPYVQLHEFEALLLAEPSAFLAQYPSHSRAVEALAALTSNYSSPELIDDGPTTAPSKRIGALIPEFLDEKASAGPIVAAQVGLATMRERCSHFAQWLAVLESLASPGATHCT